MRLGVSEMGLVVFEDLGELGRGGRRAGDVEMVSLLRLFFFLNSIEAWVCLVDVHGVDNSSCGARQMRIGSVCV